MGPIIGKSPALIYVYKGSETTPLDEAQRACHCEGCHTPHKEPPLPQAERRDDSQGSQKQTEFRRFEGEYPL